MWRLALCNIMSGKTLKGTNIDSLYYCSLLTDAFRMHSETSILTTLFALLFWDIIFWDVPGAFETPYQTEPLDLRDEIFYYARKDIVNTRLKEIRGGWAMDIIEKHDKMYREKKTWCVGMSWDLCECSDLIEVAEVSVQISCFLAAIYELETVSWWNSFGRDMPPFLRGLQRAE